MKHVISCLCRELIVVSGNLVDLLAFPLNSWKRLNDWKYKYKKHTREFFFFSNQENEFPGLIPLVRSYLGNIDVDVDTRCTVSQYLNLIGQRASGIKCQFPLARVARRICRFQSIQQFVRAILQWWTHGATLCCPQSCTILIIVKYHFSGELMTTARWMREFVQSHPDYKQDSVVSDLICYDLMTTCHKITSGELKCPKLLGNHISKTIDVLDKKCPISS